MSGPFQAGQHPDADQLNAFVEHTLPAHEQQQTLAHLAVCPACRQIVALSLPPAEEAPTWQPEAVRRRWFAPLVSRMGGDSRARRPHPGGSLCPQPGNDRPLIHPHCRRWPMPINRNQPRLRPQALSPKLRANRRHLPSMRTGIVRSRLKSSDHRSTSRLENRPASVAVRAVSWAASLEASAPQPTQPPAPRLCCLIGKRRRTGYHVGSRSPSICIFRPRSSAQPSRHPFDGLARQPAASPLTPITTSSSATMRAETGRPFPRHGRAAQSA